MPEAPVHRYAVADQMFVKGERNNKFLRIGHADLLYIKGLSNYVAIHLPGLLLITYFTLRDLAATLPLPPFLRLHKFCIVSLNKIRL